MRPLDKPEEVSLFLLFLLFKAIHHHQGIPFDTEDAMFHPPSTAQGPGYEAYQEPTSFPNDSAPVTPVLVGPSFVYPLKFNAQFIYFAACQQA